MLVNEEESYSIQREIIQPHIMKDRAWLCWEWSVQ